MSISVISPFTGEQIKVRPQDVGKAVEDRMNHKFYVLERPDGSGYYAAPTKAGGRRDIDKYDAMLAKADRAKSTGRQRSQVQIDAARGSRSGNKMKLVLLVIILIVAAWLLLFGPLKSLIGTAAG